MTVWIAQCLCPDRHCIIAVAGEADDEARARNVVLRGLRLSVREALRQQTIHPWCSLCGATKSSWRYEVGQTSFKSMDEAVPHLGAAEREQAVTNALFGDAHRTRPQ